VVDKEKKKKEGGRGFATPPVSKGKKREGINLCPPGRLRENSKYDAWEGKGESRRGRQGKVKKGKRGSSHSFSYVAAKRETRSPRRRSFLRGRGKGKRDLQ